MRAETAERVEIFDFVGGIEYDLHPNSKTYQQILISRNSASVAVIGGLSWTNKSSTAMEDPERSASMRFSNAHRSASIGVGEDLGVQFVNGVKAKGTRVTVTIPVGAFGNNRELKVVNERWYSPDLKTLVKSSNNDPRFGVNTYELTDISQAAPDPALFQPPANYALTSRKH